MMIGIEKNGIVISIGISFGKKVSKKSIGIGFENFWYRKKYRYRFRKILVSKKVSDSVLKNFGIGKKFQFRFRIDFWFRHSLKDKDNIDKEKDNKYKDDKDKDKDNNDMDSKDKDN